MRDRIDSFDLRFANLAAGQRKLINEIDEGLLYRRVDSQEITMLPASVGEFVLRSAAAVEQMIGGMTARLWDDPFEWTLPEQLPNRDEVLKYIEEVERSRQRGFAFLKDDLELNRTLPAPVEIRTIEALFNDTLTKAESYLAQATEIQRSIASRN